MAVTFKLKIKHRGASQIDSYVDKKGKVVTEKIKGAIENDVVDLAARRLLETKAELRERTLFLAAVFFQRVVSRTPMDEDYTFIYGPNDKEGRHEADDDYVRYAWTASYNNRKVTAKQLIDSGVSFIDFNDEGDIRKIYQAFRKAFIQGKGDKQIKSIHIDNNHERFPMLEYGEYEKDSERINKGGYYEHGVSNGYTVQAPKGMLRITEAEFQNMSLRMSTNRLIKEYVGKSQRINKVPSGTKMKKLKRHILDKTRLDEKDLDAIERIYGV